MIVVSRRLISFLLLLFLLIACSPAQAPGLTGNKQPGIAAATPTPRRANLCPGHLAESQYCLTPNTLRLAYNIEPLLRQGFTGKGQTIIDIVSYGSPTLQADMDKFCQQFGLPPITLQILSPIGTVPFDKKNKEMRGWAGETTLDVQIIHAIAPDAHIVVLTSPVNETEGTVGLPEFRQLEQYVLDNHLGNIVSQSWGVSEATLQDQAGQQELQKWATFYQQATVQHNMTYLSASGDHGATDVTDIAAKHLATKPTVSFPVDSPWVTGVGGTTLLYSDSAMAEEAWNFNRSDYDGSSGGGFSAFYPTPTYQQILPSSVSQQFNNRRGIPDVSAVGDPRTGLAFYSSYNDSDNGPWDQAGGTSASAPVWAGIMAIANQMAGHPLGFINPALYKLAASSTYHQDFHDITVGNNTNLKAHVQGYEAVAGWDAVTGLGTPDAQKLIPDLIAAAIK